MERKMIKLFLAKYFWFRGKPPRNGNFLTQYSNGTVKFQWIMWDSPETNNSDIIYWKRVNAPLQAPKYLLSYSPRRYFEKDNKEKLPNIIKEYY